jgi:hypothetical protein
LRSAQQLITCRQVVAHAPTRPQEKDDMEPFRVDVPDEVLNDLQTRLKLTRWADDVANEGWQYGTNTKVQRPFGLYRWPASRRPEQSFE